MARGTGVIERYREYMPSFGVPAVTLGEGNTPLLRASALEKEIARLAPGSSLEVYLKFEGTNPTGSFKDRGMTAAVTGAVEQGATMVICASTGNTAASAAAYAARAGLEAWVVLPEGAVAAGKLAQAVACGARVVEMEGNFDQALSIVREIAGAHHEVALVNSVNPLRIEGQKSGAFEVCDALGDAPEYFCIPVGNAGNITAYWRGFRQYREAGKAQGLPVMFGFQAAGAAPMVLGHPVEKPETVATAIRIGNPASRHGAQEAADQSGGGFDSVTDEEIVAAQGFVSAREGVLPEPASAASVAGLLKMARLGRTAGMNGRVVCVLTGHGLKDPEAAMRLSSAPVRVRPVRQEVERLLLG